MPQFVEALRPIEWRYTNDPAWVMRSKGETLRHNRVWLKADGPMPGDPLLHTAALVYASDTTVLDSIITTHGLSWGYDRIFAVDGESLGVVPPPGPVRRVGAVFDDLTGGSRLPRAGHRTLLRPSPGRSWPPSCKKESSSTSRSKGAGIS